ncbi:MAG TPA: hypothetical protein PLK12_06930 [Prolixibacteraceae bacterium]|nr:hypothetical protein [Prolixibacteraceae bacterium]
MKTSLILLFFLSLTGRAFARQTGDVPEKQNKISIGLGYAQYKDENLHPKAFRGLSLHVAYFHSVERRTISEYSFGLNTSFLNTRYESFPGAYGLSLNGNYHYLFPVAGNDRWHYFIGPAAGFQYGTHAFFNWDESHLYFANYLGGGVSNRLIYNFDKRSIVFDVGIPLLAVIFRPSPNRLYKIDDMTFGGIIKNLAGNPEFALPNHHFDINVRLEYRLKTSKRKSSSVAYNFRYHFMQANGGEPYRNVTQTLSYQFFF